MAIYNIDCEGVKVSADSNRTVIVGIDSPNIGDVMDIILDQPKPKLIEMVEAIVMELTMTEIMKAFDLEQVREFIEEYYSES